MGNGSLNAITILLVDDDEFALSFTKRLLEKIGVAAVLTAPGVEQAMDMLKADEVPVQVIVADIAMPDQDGFALVRRLRYGEVEKYKQVPVIMLTGKDTPRNLRRGGIHKISGFLVKPPKQEELRAEIVKAIVG